MKYRVTDKATGETRYLDEEELSRLPGTPSLPLRSTPVVSLASRRRVSFPPIPDDLDRGTTIKLIREALKKRSGKMWSVTGGTGTAYGWLHIDAPPARRIYDAEGNRTDGFGYTGPADRKELAKLLGLDNVHLQGTSVAASSAHRREYVERARGMVPTVRGEQYWD